MYIQNTQTNQCNAGNSQPPAAIERNMFCWCSAKVLGFLLSLLTFTLGLILGAVLVAIVLLALPALIILAVVLAIMIISLLIFRQCKCCPSILGNNQCNN